MRETLKVGKLKVGSGKHSVLGRETNFKQKEEVFSGESGQGRATPFLRKIGGEYGKFDS